MKNRMIVLGIISISVVAISFIGFTILKAQKKEPERVTKLPQIVSKIDSLELVMAKAQNEGKPDARAVAELRNNSNKSIIAVTIESGDEKDSSGITESGISDGDVEPVEIVKPFDTFEISIPFANLLPGFPVRISGVLYADGSADGEKPTVEMMQSQREYRRGIKARRVDK